MKSSSAYKYKETEPKKEVRMTHINSVRNMSPITNEVSNLESIIKYLH